MTFEELQKLVTACTALGGPSLYRRLYKMADDSPARAVETESEWRTLPFLTKAIQLDTPITERVFASRADIDHLRASSGTSGKPPVFSPRTYLRYMDYRREYYDFAKPMLAYHVPAMPYWHEYFQKTTGQEAAAIVLDPKYMQASARLAKLAGVESISTFAYHIQPLGEHLVREGIAQNIKFIEICGESCTRALYEYIRTTFPNATLLPFYGSSEVEDSPIGMPCRAITGEEPLSVYHAKPSQYHEIIDPETGKVVEPVEGAEGELVVSAYPGEPSAFPLIRYRTGDTVRVFEGNCARHNAWSFTLVGRTELDFVKIPGGVVRVDEAERVLRNYSSYITGRFELHYFERETPSGPKPQLELRVEIKKPIELEELASAVSQALRVNPNTTYTDGVLQGRYLPLVCTNLGPAEKLGKTKRLTKH